MRAQRGRLIALVALLLLESSVGAFLEVSNAESIRELMRDYEEGAVSAKEVQRLLNDYLEELGIAFRLRERVMCVLPSDLNTGIEHRRVEPRAGCSKLQFLSEQGGVFDNSACSSVYCALPSVPARS